MNKKFLYWSGGWDSTFELCRLSLEPVVVQPIYIIFNRLYHVGENYEINAQNNILQLLSQRNTTKAKLLPVIRVHRKDIVVPSVVLNAWRELYTHPLKVGLQYLYMASYSYTHPNIRVMISDYHNSTGRSMVEMRKTNFCFDKNGVGYIKKRGSYMPAYEVFGRMLYPIASMNQTDILNWINENKFWDIMKNVWTCFYPIDGKPCGFCAECRIKIKQHLDFMFTEEALKRGFVYNYLASNPMFSNDVNKQNAFRFALYLRLKYNPEYFDLENRVNFIPWIHNPNYNFEREYIRKFRSYFSDEYKNEIMRYAEYYDNLLSSNIECRKFNELGQALGIV